MAENESPFDELIVWCRCCTKMVTEYHSVEWRDCTNDEYQDRVINGADFFDICPVCANEE